MCYIALCKSERLLALNMKKECVALAALVIARFWPAKNIHNAWNIQTNKNVHRNCCNNTKYSFDRMYA